MTTHTMTITSVRELPFKVKGAKKEYITTSFNHNVGKFFDVVIPDESVTNETELDRVLDLISICIYELSYCGNLHKAEKIFLELLERIENIHTIMFEENEYIRVDLSIDAKKFFDEAKLIAVTTSAEAFTYTTGTPITYQLKRFMFYALRQLIVRMFGDEGLHNTTKKRHGRLTAVSLMGQPILMASNDYRYIF